MNCLLHAYSVVSLSSARSSAARSYLHVLPSNTFPWNKSFGFSGTRATNLGLFLRRFSVQSLPSQKSSKTGLSSPKTRKKASHTQKLDSELPMDAEKNAFFVVRKGDILGIYKNLSECQDQVGSSIHDPPVSVYKGYSLPKETEDHLAYCGLKNAIYSFRATDLKDNLFGMLVPCTSPIAIEPEITSTDPATKRVKIDPCVGIQAISSDNSTCILEFDGASKGNPGIAGAGAILRTSNGSVICRLREGLGKTTNNVAEYRAIILGMKCALKKGYEHIQVQGDSKLVLMQLQGKWNVKEEKLYELCEEAKKLKDNFLSFKFTHALREKNSEADLQANLAAKLAEGEIQEE